MLPTLADWLQRLQHLQTMIDAYTKCRVKHTALAPLFSADDIAYQARKLYKRLRNVARLFSVFFH